MNILIVQSQVSLGRLWQRHLERHGHFVDLVQDQARAISCLDEKDYPIIILDLVLEDGSAIAIADYANYKRPDARVLFVTNTRFFSDGSIFQLCANACAYLPTTTQPDDLAVMVEHYAKPD